MTRIIFLCCSLFVILSCKKEDPTDDMCETPIETFSSRIDITPMYGSEELYLDSVYLTQEGYRVKFITLKMLSTNIGDDNNQITHAAAFDFGETGKSFVTLPTDVGPLDELNFNVGVDNTRNHQDPSGVSINDPLNIQNIGGMHWGWTNGYIFMKVEAKVDTTTDQSGLFDQTIIFHVGKDENLQLKTLPNFQWTESSAGKYANLKLNMDTFLNNGTQDIDLKVETSSHSAPGQEVLSTKIIENFTAAIEF